MSDNRFKPYSVSTTDGDGFVIGIQKEDGTVMSITDASEMLNEQQDIITEQKEKVARVLNEYSRQFKRHSKEFSFMLDLAEDLGIESLEAKDD